MKEQRKIYDRRSNNLDNEKAFPCNRRWMPDRRLNNITVEFVSLESISAHPVTRLVFCKT